LNNINIFEECGPCPVFTGYALQLRKKQRKTLVRVAEERQLELLLALLLIRKSAAGSLLRMPDFSFSVLCTVVGMGRWAQSKFLSSRLIFPAR
jgi:hypothetical protein